MTSMKRYRSVLSGAASVARLVADIAFPPSCPACHGAVEADGNFCFDCFAKLKMIGAPLCQCCGIPFVFAIEAQMKCPICLESPPAFDTARSALVYDEVSAPLVSALKFHDQWAGLSRHARMMVGAGHEVLKEAELLIPVPLHWRRLVRRKYNQSALLAYSISAQTKIPCAIGLLQRVKPTPPQMRLDRQTRLRNVRKAFAVPLAAEADIKDKIVVLVDDVITTGATVDACAQVLKKAGAKEVRVLTLARTVKE